ncbi:type III pantothenate kinase [Vineibacter terrae]|uniref:Type III pantothenate kinase n=1 Tax=Vineibacter terrae TaxID=2586908 RepID=A0A5C8PPD8_9HYPH|nr:type III pantothenate kinase [Vineibacter terrae]TXL76696.1 type III pantothenate kinase [Vineibacter terrae]
MLLALDIGNTNSKFALFDGETLVAQWRLRTEGKRTADEYAVWLSQLMTLKGFEMSQVRGVIIASVVPAVLFNLRRLCETYFNVEPLVVGDPDVKLGIKVLIDRPQDAGADRLVDAIAGYKKYGGPLIVIDFGSGTTFEVVDRDGNFCGGAIAPGIELSIEAFYLMTARLPRIRVERPGGVIGKSTVGAMQSGIFWGYVGLIENLVTRIQAEFGEPMKVIATGGLAQVFEAETKVIQAIEPDLTLYGLLEIWRRNRPIA